MRTLEELRQGNRMRQRRYWEKKREKREKVKRELEMVEKLLEAGG